MKNYLSSSLLLVAMQLLGCNVDVEPTDNAIRIEIGIGDCTPDDEEPVDEEPIDGQPIDDVPGADDPNTDDPATDQPSTDSGAGAPLPGNG